MSDIGPEHGTPAETEQPASPPPPANDKETNQWAMFIHFSILAGWIVPLAGLIVPILLWQLKKDELPGIVPHAHIVLNWIVTSFVYAAICMVLMLVLIGVLGFIALGVVTVIYAIVGGLKANEGEIWEYPGTIIKIFK
jgi:uncharacterized protein